VSGRQVVAKPLGVSHLTASFPRSPLVSGAIGVQNGAAALFGAEGEGKAMIDPDPTSKPMQKTPSLSNELAAPDPVAVEPVGNAAREIWDPKPEDTIHEREMTEDGFNEAEGKEVGLKQDDLVNKITWAQVGRVTEPGRYMFRFGWLTLTAEDLMVWQNYPNAAFTLFKTATRQNDTDEFRLGTFELRIDSNYSESEK
jgi:hypothetical protein